MRLELIAMNGICMSSTSLAKRVLATLGLNTNRRRFSVDHAKT